MSQLELVLSYYKRYPNRDIAHAEVVDWATKEYSKKFNATFRDPDRAIRSLAQKGFLVKVGKGVYRYDPNSVQYRELENFSATDRKIILERDNYKCVVCGRGKRDGIELHVDHIKPKDLGGEATIENGQTLCAQHNFQKKNYRQTETGKKMFIRLLESAEKINDIKTAEFCRAILQVFDTFKVNGHIEWKNDKK